MDGNITKMYQLPRSVNSQVFEFDPNPSFPVTLTSSWLVVATDQNSDGITLDKNYSLLLCGGKGCDVNCFLYKLAISSLFRGLHFEFATCFLLVGIDHAMLVFPMKKKTC